MAKISRIMSSNKIQSIFQVIILTFIFSLPISCSAYTIITDLVIDGNTVDAETLEIIRTGKKNKPSSATPQSSSSGSIAQPVKITKPQIIKAFQADPKNINFEIDNSTLLVRSKEDAQAPIESADFYNAVLDAINLWNDVEIADIKINPPKFTTVKVNAEDGVNLISARAEVTPEGFSDNGFSGRALTITTIAKTNNIVFEGKKIMVKPGTILDSDTIFEPGNDPCITFYTTAGDLKTGGIPNAPTAAGGANPILAFNTCMDGLSGNEITSSTVIALGQLLGLDSSAILSSANVEVAINMNRYKLTSDDEIGLANIYPNKTKLNELGTISGKIKIKNRPLLGGHVVLENKDTGIVTVGTVTDINGDFKIIAVPPAIYTVYIEPIDGGIRPNKFDPQSFFTRNADQNFTTTVLTNTVEIKAGKETRILATVKEGIGSAFNINPKMASLFTTKEVEDIGGHSISPIAILPGQTASGVEFWGINIDKDFGTLTISGEGCTVSNVKNKSIRISDNHECEECKEDTDDHKCNRNKELCPQSKQVTDPKTKAVSTVLTHEVTKQADELPGLSVDISCSSDAIPGPRNIIFTADKLDPENPNFGLRDQITGGLIVRE